MYIDSHAHLNGILNKKDFLMFSKAKTENPYTFSDLLPENLEYLINISLHPNAFFEDYNNFSKEKKVLFANGIYPSHAHQSRKSLAKDLLILKKNISEYPLIAIGEAGIDQKNQHYGTLEEQIWLFEQQITLAEEFSLPIIIHSRLCFEECWNLIKTSKVKAVVHCFSYSKKEAEQILNRGDIISFAGNLTYPNAKEIQEVAKIVPLKNIILETDSPYLSPKPLRGAWNIPINIAHTYRFLSELREISLESLSEQIKKNFISCFLSNHS